MTGCGAWRGTVLLWHGIAVAWYCCCCHYKYVHLSGCCQQDPVSVGWQGPHHHLEPVPAVVQSSQAHQGCREQLM